MEEIDNSFELDRESSPTIRENETEIDDQIDRTCREHFGGLFGPGAVPRGSGGKRYSFWRPFIRDSERFLVDCRRRATAAPQGHRPLEARSSDAKISAGIGKSSQHVCQNLSRSMPKSLNKYAKVLRFLLVNLSKKVAKTIKNPPKWVPKTIQNR